MPNVKSNPNLQCPIKFQLLIYKVQIHLSFGFGISFVIGILALGFTSLIYQ